LAIDFLIYEKKIEIRVWCTLRLLVAKFHTPCLQALFFLVASIKIKIKGRIQNYPSGSHKSQIVKEDQYFKIYNLFIFS
jgi:hypothetical protein